MDKQFNHEEEYQKFKPILIEYMKAFRDNHDVPVEEWLTAKLQEDFPEQSAEQIAETVTEIQESIQLAEDKRDELRKARERGESANSWFAKEMRGATSHMSVQDTVNYMNEVDLAVTQANESFGQTFITKSGTINMNPQLDGFMAETHHAETFNINAVSQGSPYRAKVLSPDDARYTKDSVDIGIYDTTTNKLVRRYQLKYGKDAEHTAALFDKGDYRGQRKLVPSDQVQDFEMDVTDVLESPDGIKSNPLTKAEAQQLRDQVQSGNWKEIDWNEAKINDLAIGIGKKTALAGLQGAAFGVGFEIAGKLCSGEEIDGGDVIESAIRSGADAGVKSAAAGALKVGVEKGIIGIIPKGTPAGVIANIAHVAVEDVKVLGKVATGELTVAEGVDQVCETTVSTSAALIAAGKGAAIGAKLGTVFGAVGSAVGGFIGGAIGYVSGSKFGQAIHQAGKAIGGVVKSVVNKGKEFLSNAFSGIRNLLFG